MVKRRILIIDDEPDSTRLLKLNLEEIGTYEVREEHKGSQGLAATREFRPDLILLDLLMPEKDGGIVADEIKADERLKHIPIVFLTALAPTDATGGLGRLIGGHPFLAKPVKVEDVIQCIETILGEG